MSDYCQVHRAIELIADETGKLCCWACARWDWDNVALRAQLRIGTVLESDDFAYISVLEIAPNGVVSRGLISRRQSWSWTTLKRGEFRIYSQPGDEPVQPGATFPTIRQRGGRIPTDNDEARVLDGAIATEVLSSIPRAWSHVQVDAELVESGLSHLLLRQ